MVALSRSFWIRKYCGKFWKFPLSASFPHKLQKVQNRAARIITFSNYNTRSKDILDALNWVPLGKQRTFSKAQMIYKTLNSLAPEYLTSKFSKRNKINPYNLRNMEFKVNLPLPHTNYGKNSFTYSCGFLWNNLPVEVRKAPSIKSFRALYFNYSQ